MPGFDEEEQEDETTHTHLDAGGDQGGAEDVEPAAEQPPDLVSEVSKRI